MRVLERRKKGESWSCEISVDGCYEVAVDGVFNSFAEGQISFWV